MKPDLAASRLRRFRQREYTLWGRAIWQYYEELMDVYRQDALGHLEITPLDIERFRQVMDIFGPIFQAEYLPVLEADRNLTKMIELLKKIRRQGTIKVVELQEADDGSMTLELQVRKEPWLQTLGLSLILGGACGNLIDRIRLGEVIDFIDVHWRSVYHWPAFNVADSAITVGIIVVLICELLKGKQRRGSHA